MQNTPEFWMYILPISMVTITYAVLICVKLVKDILKELLCI
jgi:hypothetical protein